MSDDTKDDEHTFPAEQDLASTGAAADSAEPDERSRIYRVYCAMRCYPTKTTRLHMNV